MEKVTAFAVDYIATKRLARIYPYLSLRQIEHVLSAAGVKGVRGKGVPLEPALEALFEYAYQQGQSSNEIMNSADARYKKNRADLKRLEYLQKSKDVINVDVLHDALITIRGKLIDCLAGIAGCSSEIAGMNNPDPVYLRDFLKERARTARVMMDMVIRKIEEGVARKRTKGEELAAKSDDAATVTKRIFDAIHDADDMEQLEAFFEREFIGF